MSAQPQAAHSVWAIYEKYLSEFGKLVGIFSSIDLAKNCPLIQPLLQQPWQSKDIGNGFVIWQADAIDPTHPTLPFHFSIEEITVDRLAHPQPSEIAPD